MRKSSKPRPMHTMVSTLAIAMVLAGCSFAPDYQRPAAPIPVHWSHAAETAHNATDAAPDASAATGLDWQAFVTDPHLRRLVEQALAHNRDLRQTVLNVELARAQYQVQRSDRLPGIQAQAGAARQRASEDFRSPGSSSVQSSYQAGVGMAAFEIDFFSRVRNLSEAARQEYLATEEAARSAQISLVAEVIQAYLTRHGAQQRYLLASHTLDAREDSLKLVEQRLRLGAATELDVQEALGLSQQVRVELERIDRELRQASNALVLLVGLADVHALLPTSPGNNRLLVQHLAPGTPSELLVLRPDIRAAEHLLQARNASIGAARAAFFPRNYLTGLLGFSSAELSNLFQSGQLAWSFAPQITLPIFDAGRNSANLEAAQVRKDIAVAAYEQAIQVAFREVSDALAATDTLQREEMAQQALAQSSAATLRLSEARFRSGADDHLRYLDAQRNAFANQMALVHIQTQRQLALASLFRALGGGWRGERFSNASQ